jgi:hypothetical protein
MYSPVRDGGALHRVSPFGYRRISARTRLPDAFRSVPRPSSALDAQAFPVRLFWLGLSCGDRALPLNETLPGFAGVREVLLENFFFCHRPFRNDDLTHDATSFLYAFCALSIQLLRCPYNDL